MVEAHSTQMATQARLKERDVCSSKEQINKILTRIGYMMDDLWGYTELDEVGITQDVFLMYERLSHIQGVMNQENRDDEFTLY